MRTQELAAAGAKLPLIGQGTWMLEKAGHQAAIEIVRAGVDAGMTLIDTAEMYGDGAVEEIVGEAIQGIRDKVFLVSKVLPAHATFDGTRRACEASLKRLRTDFIDLYLLHWPGAHPIAETMRAFESLVNDRQIRHFGVSNFDVRDLEAAHKTLTGFPLACNQVVYHLEDRGIERRLLPFCASRGIAVMGYSPFGHDAFPVSGSPEHAVLERIAARHNSTAHQVALAFLIRNGQYTIPKSVRIERVRENAAAAAIELSAADINAIDQVFPAPNRDTPLGMI